MTPTDTATQAPTETATAQPTPTEPSGSISDTPGAGSTPTPSGGSVGGVCKDFKTADVQFALDGSTFSMKSLITHYAQRLYEEGFISKKHYQKYVADAKKRYTAVWGNIWSLPATISTECASTASCVTISLASSIAEVKNRANDLFAVIQKLLKEAKKEGSKKLTKQLSTKAQSALTKFQGHLSKLPTTTSSCH